MAPVSVQRLVQKLEKVKQQMDAALQASDYDQRLARVIRERLERKLEADRLAIAAALAAALRRDVITLAVRVHTEKRLGSRPRRGNPARYRRATRSRARRGAERLSRSPRQAALP
jgi:hypothetical protein